MHLCPSAAVLYQSLRNEQTVVLGFQVTVEKVLTVWQVILPPPPPPVP